jgi:hypothetical protein
MHYGIWILVNENIPKAQFKFSFQFVVMERAQEDFSNVENTSKQIGDNIVRNAPYLFQYNTHRFPQSNCLLEAEFSV